MNIKNNLLTYAIAGAMALGIGAQKAETATIQNHPITNELKTESSFVTNAGGIGIRNYTENDIWGVKIDLKDYVANSDFLKLRLPFGWNETGDKTDSVFEFFKSVGYIDPLKKNGGFLPINIDFNTTDINSPFYGLDMSSFEATELKDAITGFSEGGDPYFGNVKLPDYNTSNVPIPGSGLLLGSGLVGLIGLARKQYNKDQGIESTL